MHLSRVVLRTWGIVIASTVDGNDMRERKAEEGQVRELGI